MHPRTVLSVPRAFAALFIAAVLTVALAHFNPTSPTLLLAAAPAVLVAKRGELDEKRKKLAGVFEAAGGELDFGKKEVLEQLGVSDSAAAIEKVRALNTEIEALFDETKKLADMDGMRARLGDIGSALEEPAGAGVRHADPTQAPRAIGDVIVGSAAYQSYLKHKAPASCEVQGFGLREIRAALFETGAGWAPESLRSGKVVEAVTRPLQVIDIIPMGTTNQAAYVFMEETTRTHNAAEKAEGATFAESAFALTEKSQTVRKITDSVPVTDEQLEDVAGVQSYLNQRLTFGLRQRFDNQVLNGDGVAPNLAGILNTVGIQTHAKGADNAPDAIHKALTLIRVTGRALPDYVIMNPTDWENIRLLKDANGTYIWGPPSDAGVPRIWGLPVVQADSLAQGTALPGAFQGWCQAFERRGIDIQVGYSGTQFVEGKKTIRADMRLVFVVFRPAAFCTVTGL